MLPEHKLAKVWSFTSDYHKVKPVKDAICVGAAGGIPIWRMPFFTLYSHNAESEEPANGYSLTHHRSVGWNDEVAKSWDTREPNHHSVAFDAQASTYAEFASSVTITGFVMGTGTNRYLGLFQVNAGLTNLTSITWNSSSTGINLKIFCCSALSYFDLVNPTSGTHDITFTFDAGSTFIVGAESFTGVDQSTPIGTIPTPTSGTSTAPSITTVSATGNEVLSFSYWDGTVCTTNTVDATWVSDFSFRNPAHDIGATGAHKVGAASVVRTDTLNASCGWYMLSVPLNASGTGGSTKNGLLLQQVIQ